MQRDIVIDRRFRGPPESANGGYAAGILAEGVDGTAVATLRSPPPLDTSLTLDGDGKTSHLVDGEDLIGEAEAAGLELAVPVPPSLPEAAAASQRFVVHEHIFPGCFVCGPERQPGDGLRLFAGPVEGSDLVAAPWTPDTSLAADGEPIDRRYVWATLDCPSYFALEGAPYAVLGRITAAIDRVPTVGEQLIAMAWPMGDDGRKRYSGSALATPDGEIIARAKAVWIELERDGG